MSDIRIRRHDRLVDRLRAGLLVPSYTEAREIACSKCVRGWVPCNDPQCGDSTWDHNCTEHKCDCVDNLVPYDAMDQIRLLAYLGNVEARELATGPCVMCGGHLYAAAKDGCTWGGGCWANCAMRPLPYPWTKVLRRLTAKLPPARVQKVCTVIPAGHHDVCSGCGGSGFFRHDTKAELYLLIVAAYAVGLAARRQLVVLWTSGELPNQHLGFTPDTSIEALRATRDWIEEPTNKNLTTWNNDLRQQDEQPEWIIDKPWMVEDVIISIQAGAEMLGEARAKELVSSTLLKVL